MFEGFAVKSACLLGDGPGRLVCDEQRDVDSLPAEPPLPIASPSLFTFVQAHSQFGAVLKTALEAGLEEAVYGFDLSQRLSMLNTPVLA